jgi:hypothetical protein
MAIKPEVMRVKLIQPTLICLLEDFSAIKQAVIASELNEAGTTHHERLFTG